MAGSAAWKRTVHTGDGRNTATCALCLRGGAHAFAMVNADCSANATPKPLSVEPFSGLRLSNRTQTNQRTTSQLSRNNSAPTTQTHPARPMGTRSGLLSDADAATSTVSPLALVAKPTMAAVSWRDVDSPGTLARSEPSTPSAPSAAADTNGTTPIFALEEVVGVIDAAKVGGDVHHHQSEQRQPLADGAERRAMAVWR